MLLIMIICSSGYGLFIASIYKAYGGIPDDNDVKISDGFLTVVGSIGAVLNGLCRMFWATLQDKTGFKLVYIVMCVCQAVLIFTLPFIHTQKWLYLIWISLSYFFYGGHYSIFPTVTAKLYGAVTGPKVYPIIFIGFALSTVIGVILAKVVIPKLSDRGAGAYHPIFYVQGGLTIVSIILAFIFVEQPQ